MLRTCFGATAAVSLRGVTVSTTLKLELSVKSCSLARMGQVRVKYLNAEDGVPHAEKTCRNQGFLVAVETGSRDHRNPGATIL